MYAKFGKLTVGKAFENKLSYNRWRNTGKLVRSLAVLDAVTNRQLIQCDFRRTESRVYCSLVVQQVYYWRHAIAFAGGGGYHKSSAALQTALEKCGINLSDNIHGVGDSAIDEALLAIASAMNCHQARIVEL